jgi:hypothetical protein
MNSKPWRAAALGAAAISSLTHGIGTTLFRRRYAPLARASRARLRLSFFSRVSASPARFAVFGAIWRRKSSKQEF